MRRVLLLAVAAALHFGATLGLLALAVGSIARRIAEGGGSTVGERFVEAALYVFGAPLLLIAGAAGVDLLAGPMLHLVAAANSVVAVALVWAAARFLRRRRRAGRRDVATLA